MRKLLFALAFLGLSGCFKAEITGLSEGALGLTHNKKAHVVLFGLAPLNDVNVKQICGDKGALKVATIHSFIDMVLSGITLGIYTPVTVKVTCAA